MITLGQATVAKKEVVQKDKTGKKRGRGEDLRGRYSFRLSEREDLLQVALGASRPSGNGINLSSSLQPIKCSSQSVTFSSFTLSGGPATG